MEQYLINPNQKIATISKDLYGHFSEHLGRCIYEGLYVGENSGIPNVNGMRCDVVQALREMGIPVLRWPGGCFADEYHWKDGIGPKETRKKMINTHWGGVVEDNSFGTHEFQELIRQLGCDCYIAGNVGSGTVQEMSEWVEYMTFAGQSPMSELRRKNGQDAPWRLTYFGVGNENWGCGGNMDPAYYANEFKRYATYVRNYDPKNNWIYKVACGPNGEDYHWTEELMRIARWHMNGLALHYYTVCGDWGRKGKAAEFTEQEYYTTLNKAYHINHIIDRHLSIMNHYDPDHRVDLIVDEWGTWYDVEEGTNPGFLYQQNTMRDALVAGLTLNVFNKHADRIRMANIAQTVNVLQSVALTDGPDMVLTPTYYVFKMYKDHQRNTLLGSYVTTEKIGVDGRDVPQLVESASMNAQGEIVATVTNLAADRPAALRCQVADRAVASVTAEILAGDPHDHNTFERKHTVGTKPFTDVKQTADGFLATLPPCSVAKFVIR